MQLGISFYAQSKLDPDAKEEVGYFRKASFILTYFNISIEDSGELITISRKQFAEFANDLNIERIHHDVRHNSEPWNQKLRVSSVFCSGFTEYDDYYWATIEEVCNWAAEILNRFHWTTDEMAILCFWQFTQIIVYIHSVLLYNNLINWMEWLHS